MLKNYLKIALRNIRRQPGYSAINVGGLAIGMVACMLILFYILDELSFDRFNTNNSRLFRVVELQTNPEGGEMHTGFTAGPVGPAMVQDMPEVEQAVRLVGRYSMGRRTVEKGENRFYEEHYFFTEPALFELFDFHWIQGNPENALTEPKSVVLTEKARLQYFGDQNPVGQTLFFEGLDDLLITGVIENPPHNSHLDFNFLVSYSTLEGLEGWNTWLETWDSSRILTYLLLKDAADAPALEAKFPAFMKQYQAERFGVERLIYLQSVAAIHFNSLHIDAEENDHEGNLAYIYIFFFLALFLLLIASVNYINLATAQAMKRAREVGVRKALGAHQKQLVGQFLGESGFITALAFLIALIGLYLFLPIFNQLSGKQIELSFQTESIVFGGVIGVLFLVWFFTGGYPAFYLSRFQPVGVLKGQFKAGPKASRFRQVLVVTQFSLCIALIIGTFAISNQLDYMQNKHLGYASDAQIAVDINSGSARAGFESMKNELMQVPSVQQVSVSSNIPGDWKDIPLVEARIGGATNDASHSMYFIGADNDFLSTFEIPLVSGRNFSDAFVTDSTAVLLNETAASLLGIAEPAGQIVEIPRPVSGTASETFQYQVRVIGIVKDFHYKSLHDRIAPLMIGYWSNPVDVIDYFTIKVQTADLASTILQLRGVGEKYDPDHPFEYNFLDDRLEDFYRTETRINLLFSIAAALAIFIACLGLLGLAAFSAEQRIKEIGVRKVLGASLGHIVKLMTGDFLKLVVIAFVIGAPFAFWALSTWLETFAYKTSIGIGTLAITFVLSVGIAFFTVLYQSLKAALSDPVKTLRYE